MKKTFRELIIEAQFSETEADEILKQISIATYGLTLQKLKTKLPESVTDEFHLLDDEEKVSKIVDFASQSVTQENVKKIIADSRQELVNEYNKNVIQSRLKDLQT